MPGNSGYRPEALGLARRFADVFARRTFAVKNADVSVAMLADKQRHALDTGAEVCAAADTSCLMHIGGGRRRQRTGVRTMHLAEILASTEEEPG